MWIYWDTIGRARLLAGGPRSAGGGGGRHARSATAQRRHGYHTLLYFKARSVKLSTRDKEQFLQWIEKDVAHLYFCFKCVKLHRWNHHWTSNGRWAPQTKTKDCLAGFEYHADYHWQSTIRYHHARLVMSRHLYGASHGLPLKTLEHDRGTVRFVQGVRAHWATSARIIDDELFVRRTLTMWHPGGGKGDLQEFLRDRPLYLCTHVTTTGPELRYCLRIPEFEGPVGDIPLCQESLGSCPMCLMDYSMTVVHPQERNSGWLINIAMYQQLGGCRSPFDWKWRISSRGCPRNQPRSYIEKPGIVRHRWSQMDNVTIPPGGEFVGRAYKLYQGRARQCSYHSLCHSERVGDPHSEYGSY